MTDEQTAEELDEDAGPSDALEVKGRLRLELFEDGELVDERIVENIVTTVGRNAIADQVLAAPTLGKPTHMALGTSGTAETVGDTALGAEVGGSRVALTSKTRAGNVVTYVGDFGAGVGAGALQEAGIFDAGAAGNMWHRVTFAVMNKSATATLRITWTLTIG